MGAQLARRAGQQPAAADVRHQADPGLGECHHRTLGDDPHRAVGGDADAAAHGDAVHHGHVGLRVAGDQLVQPVLVPEERPRPGPAELGVVVEHPDVAARAQAALPGAGQHHDPHRVVPGPRVQRGPHVQHHAVRQRVERPGPVEHDPPHPAVPPDQHLVAHRPHSRPSSPTDPSDTVLVVGDGAGRCDHGRPSWAGLRRARGQGGGEYGHRGTDGAPDRGGGRPGDGARPAVAGADGGRRPPGAQGGVGGQRLHRGGGPPGR